MERNRSFCSQASCLGQSQFTELQYCYQIALYLTTYLNAISFNTDCVDVRATLHVLHLKLSHMDLKSVSKLCRRTLFNILLYVAMASRSHLERAWFLQLLPDVYVDV